VREREREREREEKRREEKRKPLIYRNKTGCLKISKRGLKPS